MRDRIGYQHLRRTAVAVVNGIGGAAVGHRSHIGPGDAVQINGIARIAVNDELMPAFAGAESVGAVDPTQPCLRAAVDQVHAHHVLHIAKSNRQRVIATAGEVNAFDGGNT